MAKKVILKDENLIEVMPITRAELVLDSAGNLALHSREFLATDTLPGLMSPDDKQKLETVAGNTVDTELSNTSTNPVQNKVLTQIINSIRDEYVKSAVISGNKITITDQSDNTIEFSNSAYQIVTDTIDGLVPKYDAVDGIMDTHLTDWVLTNHNGTLGWYKLPANAFKNDNTNTTYSLSGALNGNTYITTLTDSDSVKTMATVPAMSGASSTAAGAAGLVPAPAINNHTAFLRGDGTWVVPTNYYRPISVNGTSILENDNTALNLVAGANISITAENSSGYTGKVTITNTGVRSTTINGNCLRVDTNGTNADLTIPYATLAGSVAWENITDKPSSFAPSAHDHTRILFIDDRDTDETPTDVAGKNGIEIHFKNKSKSGITSTGTWTAIVMLDGYSDVSGGYPMELGFSMSDLSESRPLYLRTPKSATEWGSWRTILDSSTYTNYTVQKDGTGASGTWDIDISGTATSSTLANYSRNLLGRKTSGDDYDAVAGNLIFAEWNTHNDNRWYLKAEGYETRVAYATSAGSLGGYNISNFMVYADYSDYVAASFTDENLSKKAGEKYIEYWDSAGGWFNSTWGKVTAHAGFVGNLTGTASYATSAGNADKLDDLHATSFAIWRGDASTDPTATDTGSTSTADFFARINATSGLFNSRFGAMRGSWWYVGNTQLDTGVGTLEMAGTAVLNLGSYADTNDTYKSLLFLDQGGRLWSYTANETAVKQWSRYVKTTDKIANASWADGASTVTVYDSDANSTYRMVWHSGNTLYGTGGIYCNPSSDSMYASFMELSRTTNHGLKVGSIRGTAVGSRTGEYIHMYERVHIGSPNGWGSNDAPSNGLSTYGGAWFAVSTGSVGIGNTSPSYKLHVSGDSYTTGWSRAASGFYVEGTGVHYTSQGSVGEINLTWNNEFLYSTSNGTLYFNYRGASRGTTVTEYIWNAGSSSSYAKHTLGALTAKGDQSLYGLTSTCNKANDANYMNSALQIREYNFGGAQSDTWAIAPRLSWHWSGRVLTQIGLNSSGDLKLSKDNFANSYLLLHLGNTYVTNGTGVIGGTTITQVSNADTVDGYHATDLLREFWTNSPGYDGNAHNSSPIVTFSYSNNTPYTGVFVDLNSNGYGVMFNTCYYADSQLAYKRHGTSSDGGMGSWRYLIDNVTIGSQSVNYANSAGSATKDSAGNTISSYYLPLSGGTMTGTITTPGNDTVVIKPKYNNYDQIGGEGQAFWKIWATNFYGSLHGNAASATYATSAGSANGLASTGYGNGNLTYYQTSSDFFGNSGWSHYIIANHGDGSSYYNFTIGLPFWGVPIYKRLEGGGADGWHTFITSENISSQSVNYASSAGNANTVDNYHIWAGSSSSLPASRNNNTIYLVY